MSNPLDKMFPRLVVRQEAPLYLLQVPFFVYFLMSTFEYATRPLFMAAVLTVSVLSFASQLLVKHRVMAPMLRVVREGPDVDCFEQAIHNANRFATIDALAVTVRYAIAGSSVALVCMIAYDAPLAEAFVLCVFSVANGALCGAVYYFIAEREADAFLNSLGSFDLELGPRLGLQAKLVTFCSVATGYLLTFFFIIVHLQQMGLVTVDDLPAKVYPFAAATLLFLGYGFAAFTKSLSGKLDNLKDRLHDIRAGNGDLSQKVPLGTRDEITEVAAELNGFVDQLRGMVGSVVETAEALEEASRGFVSAAEGLATDTGNMGEQSTEAAAAMEQLSAGLSTIAHSASEVSGHVSAVAGSASGVSNAVGQVAGSSKEMSVDVTSVSAAVEEMSASLGEVARGASLASEAIRAGSDKARRASEQMEALGRSASEIGQVVELIEDIADQTNMLALNATIEAASAGDAGRGFAVVANEVKALAKQTTAATEQIAHQIERMRRDTDASLTLIREVTSEISSVDESAARIAASVEEQTATVSEIAGNLGRTASAATDIDGHVQGISTEVSDVASRSNAMTMGAEEISRSSQEVATGATEVSSQISFMNDAVRRAADRAGEVRGQATSLSKLAQTLNGLVRQFKTA